MEKYLDILFLKLKFKLFLSNNLEIFYKYRFDELIKFHLIKAYIDSYRKSNLDKAFTCCLNHCNHCLQEFQNPPVTSDSSIWAFPFRVSFFPCIFLRNWSAPLQSTLSFHPPTAWNPKFILLKNLLLWKSLPSFVCRIFLFLILSQVDLHTNTSLAFAWTFSLFCCFVLSFQFLTSFSRDFDSMVLWNQVLFIEYFIPLNRVYFSFKYHLNFL